MSAYGQTQPYIPVTDAALRDWLTNFSALLTADPTRYGLDASDATVIAGHAAAYASAYQAVQAPSTRTSTGVAQKDAVKASAVASVRVYAQMIKANAGVSNDDKIALGVHVNDPTPSPIPAPASAPMLMIVSAFSGVHHLRYADENTPAARRKPHGVLQLQLNAVIAPAPAVDPGESRFVGLYTKQPVLVEHEPASAGLTATYFARWVTRTGKTGPWSLPESMTVAFGGAAQAIPDGGTLADGQDLQIAA
jgi:hypothetical protein